MLLINMGFSGIQKSQKTIYSGKTCKYSVPSFKQDMEKYFPAIGQLQKRTTSWMGFQLETACLLQLWFFVEPKKTPGNFCEAFGIHSFACRPQVQVQLWKEVLWNYFKKYGHTMRPISINDRSKALNSLLTLFRSAFKS